MWRHVKSKLLGVALVLAVIGAISPAIAAATREIQTNICGDFATPTITSPVPGQITQNNNVIVTGRGEASLPITIINNGTAVSLTAVSSSGDYSISVPLTGGVNVIIAKEVNACGSAKKSEPTSVQRNIAPQAPVKNESSGQAPAQPTNIVSVLSGQSPSSSLGQPMPNHQNTPEFSTPVIKQPAPDVIYTTNKVWVSGTAEPLSLVTIYVNGVSVARLRASSSGDFGAMVELNIGSNNIQIGAEKDGKSAISELTTVVYTPKKSVETGASQLELVGLIAGMAATAVAATGAGIWIVKFISIRRLR